MCKVSRFNAAKICVMLLEPRGAPRRMTYVALSFLGGRRKICIFLFHLDLQNKGIMTSFIGQSG